MKITYLELLKMVVEGKQPSKIKYGTNIYTWDGGEYRHKDNGVSLSKELINWTTRAQTTAGIVETVQDVLTKKEKPEGFQTQNEQN